MSQEERLKLREYIAQLFRCGWEDDEVERALFEDVDNLMVFGHLLSTQDLIAVIRDLMWNPNCEEAE